MTKPSWDPKLVAKKSFEGLLRRRIRHAGIVHVQACKHVGWGGVGWGGVNAWVGGQVGGQAGQGRAQAGRQSSQAGRS